MPEKMLVVEGLVAVVVAMATCVSLICVGVVTALCCRMLPYVVLAVCVDVVAPAAAAVLDYNNHQNNDNNN
jgi:hypothetical protein